jgi:hypothetical protein
MMDSWVPVERARPSTAGTACRAPTDGFGGRSFKIVRLFAAKREQKIGAAGRRPSLAWPRRKKTVRNQRRISFGRRLVAFGR